MGMSQRPVSRGAASGPRPARPSKTYGALALLPVSSKVVSNESAPSERYRATLFVPMAVWITGYEKSNLLPDFIAALTVWALMVPEAMAYASIAGMPPETGLYAALVAPIAYAVRWETRRRTGGTSRRASRLLIQSQSTTGSASPMK